MGRKTLKTKLNILAIFLVLPLLFNLKAGADFSHLGIAPNLTPCFPYSYDTGPEIVQIVGIVNRTCLYRVIKSNEMVECNFNHAQLSHMLEEIKSRPKFVFNTLDTLNTFQKYQVTPSVCKIIVDDENLSGGIRSEFSEETHMPMSTPTPMPMPTDPNIPPPMPEAPPPMP